MQLARDWSQLIAEYPEGFSSQRQAFKALAAIARAEENRQPKAIDGKGAARCANAARPRAARGVKDGAPARSGPVWRASGPFVNEALRLVSAVDATLSKLVSRGYPLASEADKVHATLKRLQTIFDREIDEAEALQAAGEWTFVVEEAPAAAGAAAIELESEDDHDD
jgi:hypothetical protein